MRALTLTLTRGSSGMRYGQRQQGGYTQQAGGYGQQQQGGQQEGGYGKQQGYGQEEADGDLEVEEVKA